MARLAWLAGTNVVSEMMRPRPEPRAVAFLDSIVAEGMGLAFVTVWEILSGIGRLDHGLRRRELTERFQDLLDDLFGDRGVAWSTADAWGCARIMEAKRRCGESLDHHFPDAAAAVRGLVIVTGHRVEFRNTGVETVDPRLPSSREQCVQHCGKSELSVANAG